MAGKTKKNKISSAKKSFLKSGLYLLIILAAAYFLVTYVFRKQVVHNVSMQDTLFDGDNFIMDELSYNISDPKRYDIVCFKSYKEKDLLIKRVIGLPNEKVTIKNEKIYINDKEIKDIKGLMPPKNAGLAADGVTLSDDEYFVIGDNREESIDSRSENVGNIRRSEIIGKAVFIIYPFDRIGIIK